MVSESLEDGLEEELIDSKEGVPLNVIQMRDIQNKREEYPYNIICHLRMIFDNGLIEYGTGSLIHKKVLITSAHNCYSFFNRPEFNKIGKAFVTEMTIIPSGGFSTLSKIIHIRKGGPNANCFVATNWLKIVDSAPNGNYEGMTYNGDSRGYDYAFIILDDPFPFSKYFNLKYQQNLLESDIRCCNRTVNTTNGSTLNYLESSSTGHIGSVFELDNDVVLKIDPNKKKTICHLMDTQPAVSGGPIYISAGQGNFSIIGIHSAGHSGKKKNFATRVDERIIQDFKDIVNQYIK